MQLYKGSAKNKASKKSNKNKNQGCVLGQQYGVSQLARRQGGEDDASLLAE